MLELDRNDVESNRERRRHVLHGVSRRVALGYAAIVGIVAGLLAVAFQQAVALAEHFATWLAAQTHGNLFLIAALAAGAALVAGATAHLIGAYAPEAGGSGIPHIKAALLHLKIVRPVRIVVAKFLGGVASLAVGMSLGREGPTVQMGSAIGKLTGDVLRAPKRARGTLLAAGAGAGLAAAFNAPLAGFIFVMEELKREMSALTYGAALIASVCAVGVTRYLEGEHPSFNLPSPGTPPLSILPYAAVLGVVAGAGGVLFNRALFLAIDIRQKRRIPRWIYGAVVGVISALLLVYFPYVSGGGHGMAETLLANHFTNQPLLPLLLAIFLGKLLFTAACYGTGVPGGIFAPILVMGSFLGYAVGLIAHQVFPGVPFGPEGFATLGMAALLAASVRAPLTGVVLIVEMTAEYGLLYALLVTAFVASLTAELMRDKPVYEELMERSVRTGADVHEDAEPVLLEILIEPHSLMDGKRVRHLGLPPGTVLATLERGSKHLVPGGSTVLSAGDMVTVMVEGDKPELCHRIHDLAKAPG